MSFAAPQPKSVTLEQLLALNSEIAALARAGVPLERGLKELGRDMPGRLGAAAEEIANRLDQGESLDRVLANMSDACSPAYRAVVSAGLRSGRLAAALEGIAAVSRRIAEMRRTMLLAVIYPTILLVFAYATFVFTIHNLSEVFLEAFEKFSTGGVNWFAYLGPLHDNLATWAPWPPILFVVLAALWWWRAGRVQAGGAWLGGFSTIGRMNRYGRVATFADTLALLVEQNVPLTDAIPLAADASGDAQLVRGAKELAARIERGETDTVSSPPAGFPPLLAWLVATGERQTQLQQSLRRAAADYHDRAEAIGDWATIYLPIILAVGIGLAAIAAQAVILLAPWYSLLIEISRS